YRQHAELSWTHGKYRGRHLYGRAGNCSGLSTGRTNLNRTVGRCGMTFDAADKVVMKGRAWRFGDTSTTDELYPRFALRLPVEEASWRMFHSVRPGWPEQVTPGDIVVAGRNFGLGSSRAVPLLFQHLGVSCLVAEYFNSLFLRNCINYGLPAI